MTISRRNLAGIFGSAFLASGQEAPPEFICPMDADIRQKLPGRCPRCGMKLVAGLPDPVEYPVRVTLTPRAPRAAQKVRLRLEVLHPKTRRAVIEFETVHERIMHLFLISGDLQHFAHEHPSPQPDGSFILDWTFPIGGLWRLLCDYYPAKATPQLTAKTLLLPGGALLPPSLKPDVSGAMRGENLSATLRLEPSRLIAGQKALLYYEVSPRAGFELYLGAAGHMLVASNDLIDLIHTHPFLVDGGVGEAPAGHKLVQFNVTFPRPGVHRVWAQFQRLGVVNTIAFNVPVLALGQTE